MELEDNQFNSNIASTSTATPKAKLLELIAALVCMPESPKILAIVSDAPLITFGCSVKSSVEFTNPVSFIQDLIFERSFDKCLLACDTMFKAHLIAAS